MAAGIRSLRLPDRKNPRRPSSRRCTPSACPRRAAAWCGRSAAEVLIDRQARLRLKGTGLFPAPRGRSPSASASRSASSWAIDLGTRLLRNAMLSSRAKTSTGTASTTLAQRWLREVIST